MTLNKQKGSALMVLVLLLATYMLMLMSMSTIPIKLKRENDWHVQHRKQINEIFITAQAYYIATCNDGILNTSILEEYFDAVNLKNTRGGDLVPSIIISGNVGHIQIEVSYNKTKVAKKAAAIATDIPLEYDGDKTVTYMKAIGVMTELQLANEVQNKNLLASLNRNCF